jgi:hypothetical protein
VMAYKPPHPESPTPHLKESGTLLLCRVLNHSAMGRKGVFE